MLEALGDPHTIYLEELQLEDFTTQVQGEFGGVGIVITEKDGRVVVVSVLKETPAAGADIQPNDAILAVDGEETEGMSSAQVAARIRGDVGTAVTLTLDRVGREPFDVTIERAVIRVPSTEARVIEGYGYLAISNFDSNTGEEVRKALADLEAKGIKGLILDLRHNPGGLLDQGVEVAEQFVYEGPVVYVDSRSGRKTYYSETPPKDYPVVVLIDGGTASAAEIVAGAIQDWQTGVLVGTRTFGKGSVQTLVPVPGGGAVKLTIARYRTPTGRTIDGVGLTPDVVVELPEPKEFRPLEIHRDLRKGMIGLDVQALQESLNALGYNAGLADGIFGPKTLAAVEAFARDKGIAPVVNREFTEALNRSLADLGRVEDTQLEKAIEILRSK